MSDYFQLFNRKTNKKLAENWDRPIVYDGDDFEDQFWCVADQSGDYFKLRNKQTKKWLADSDGALVLFGGHHCDDQYWKLVQYPDDCVRLENKLTGRWLAESSDDGKPCVYVGQHHLDQLWNAVPRHGLDKARPNCVPEKEQLDEASFCQFAPLLAASQDYASHSGCRFSTASFNGISNGGYQAAGEPLEESQAGKNDAPQRCDSQLLAKRQALPMVSEFTERLQAGELALMQELAHAIEIESAESIRNAMIGTFQALELFPPEPLPEGVSENDCEYTDVSAPLPIIALRLYNDQVRRIRDSERGIWQSQKRAKTAAFIIEFAEGSCIDLPPIPEELVSMWNVFVERTADPLKRQNSQQRVHMSKGTVGRRLREDSKKWWDEDLVWAAGVGVLGAAVTAAAVRLQEKPQQKP